jgi:hypothetical protein
MKVRITIVAITMMLTVSTAMLAMQRGQTGRPAGIGASSNPGVSHASSNLGATAADDHRQNAVQPADHKPETAGQKDSQGFKNYGQYVAATQISEHLNIPLADLKKAMVDDKLSLGDAIHKLRPDLTAQQVQSETKQADAAAKKAEAKKKSS